MTYLMPKTIKAIAFEFREAGQSKVWGVKKLY